MMSRFESMMISPRSSQTWFRPVASELLGRGPDPLHHFLHRLVLALGSGPTLDESKLDQIAALPLGGRIKLDPWGDHVEMIKAAAVSYTSVRDKMPFEVTPFFPRLTRLGTNNTAQATPVDNDAAKDSATK